MKKLLLVALVLLTFLGALMLRCHPSGLPGAGPGGPAGSQGEVSGDAGPATVRAPSDDQPQERPRWHFSETALLGEAEAETDPARRSEALDRAARGVPEAELAATLQALAGSKSPVADALSERLVRRWAERDPAGAAAWAAQQPAGAQQVALLQQVAIAWATTNVSAAATWAGGLPEGAAKQAALLSLSYEANRSDPLTALDLAATLAPTPQRDGLLLQGIGQWASADPATALAWAEKIPDPSLRANLLSAAAIAMAKQDGAAAATLAAESLESGELQDRTVVAVVQRWAQQSPQDAAAWVARFPDTPACAAALQNLVTSWTSQDSQAAANWLRALPEGPQRSLAWAAYQQALRYSLPR